MNNPIGSGLPAEVKHRSVDKSALMTRSFGPAAPAEVVEAVAGLNSWLRSAAYKQLGPNGLIRKAIYWYKNRVLSALAQHGQVINTRLISVEAECRDCYGTGLYVDSGGYQHDHCWRCGCTGQVTLEFYESRLVNGMVWHTPRLKAPLALIEMVEKDAIPVPAQDWSIEQLGRSLTPDRVAHALNTVEMWLYPGEDWPECYEIRWRRNDIFYYKLPLGERPKTCAFCGTNEVKGAGYCTGADLVTWDDWICEGCHINPLEFPKFPMPTGLIAPQPIQTWLERRAGWRKYSSMDEVLF